MNFIYQGLITSAVSIMASEKKNTSMGFAAKSMEGQGTPEGAEVDRQRPLG